MDIEILDTNDIGDIILQAKKYPLKCEISGYIVNGNL